MNPILVIILVTLLGGVVAPPVVDATIGNSIEPNSPLYPYERWGEQIRLKLAELGIGNYTQLLEQIMDERINETEYCIEHNCTDKVQALLKDYNHTVQILIQHLVKHNKTQRLFWIQQKLQHHKQEIQHLLNITITTGHGEVEIAIENTIQTINQTIHEIEIHITK